MSISYKLISEKPIFFNRLIGMQVTSQKIGGSGIGSLMNEVRKLRYLKSFAMPVNQIIPKINPQL